MLLCSSYNLQTIQTPLSILKQLHLATNHSKLPLIKSSGCTSGVRMHDCLQKLQRSTNTIHSVWRGYSSLSIAQTPALASLKNYCKPKKKKKKGLKYVFLQFRKDVINFRSRAKVVQENSVYFWSEIILRYWIILGNKRTRSVNGLIPSLSSSLPFSLPLPSLSPSSFHFSFL